MHAERMLYAQRCCWCNKRGRVDGRHPDPCLVDFEEICHERVEVDVGISKVVERELFPVPERRQLWPPPRAKTWLADLHLELCI
jgi:hypothetical protein